MELRELILREELGVKQITVLNAATETPVEPSPSSRTSQLRLVLVLRETGWAVLSGLVFVALFAQPHVVAADDLDPSWAQTLAELHIRGAQAGADTIFSYGPLYLLL